MTQHPDEGALHAYIDGELPRAEAEALEAHVGGCASCSAALAEARGLVAATSQVITALDAAPATARTAESGVARPSVISTRRAERPVIFRIPYARAAALLLLVGGSAFVADRRGVFDGRARSRTVSATADAVQRSEPSVAAAPEAATSAAASAPPSPTPADISSATVGSASGVAARPTAPAPRIAANSPTRDGARAIEDQRSTVATDSLPASRLLDAAAATALKRVEPAEALATSAVTPGTRVSRYRTKEGTILTLTEETLRTSFAEESDTRRTAAARVQRPTAAPISAPAVSSYRWSNPEQARTYTLTGPLPVAELEALSKRLSELERVP